MLVGFGSHSGTVIAPDEWGDVPRIMEVPPAHAGSLEDLLHQALPGGRALLPFRMCSSSGRRPPAWASGSTRSAVTAIGVVYRPQFERVGHYVPTVLAQRHDAFCYLDSTHALTPLHPLSAERLEEQAWPVGVGHDAGSRHGGRADEPHRSGAADAGTPSQNALATVSPARVREHPKGPGSRL
ncbi:erythromycin esterase family protein [Streptomyces regalis]|uniref:erythromycin esterase family protein n=1 Tax=Streptomyces regalis TaxID=68262 RepID=UPI0014288E5A|nr:erythromycin esterase family protein [Streptomyces regalis]